LRTAWRPGGAVAVLTAAMLALLCAGCDGKGDTGASGLQTAIEFTQPDAAATDLVWIRDGGGGGDMRIAEIVARDVTGPFDSYNIEFSFDTAFLEALSFSPGTVLGACSAIQAIELDNVSSGLANTDGTVLFSASLTGSPPPGCSVTGTMTLARITFRARGQGESPLVFIPYNGDPNTPEGSVFFRRDPLLAVVPVQFYDSGATVVATR